MRPFADVLRELCGGSTYDELTARLSEVVEAVTDTRKIGEITIRLKVKPNGETGVIVSDEIKTKLPDRKRGETVFFVTANGSLVCQDPRQDQLPFRCIPNSQTVVGDGMKAADSDMATLKTIIGSA